MADRSKTALTPTFWWTASSPVIHSRASSSRAFASLASSARHLLLRLGRLAPVAVVRLVVDDHDLAVLAQVVADAVHHLVGRLGERAGRVGGQHPLGQPARVALLAELEGVEVGDDDLRRAQVAAVLGRDDVEFPVVVVRVGRQQDAEPVADGDAGGDDEEGVGEPVVVRVAALVEHLPRDEHGHDDRLAAAGRHLARDAEQLGPGLVGLLPEVLLDPVVARTWSASPPR